jgi:hypothetical protein
VPEPACETEPVIPPGLDVAVYDVIAVPPLLAGAVYVTVADVLVATVAAPIVGAPGTVQVVIEFDAELAALVPIAFVAVTVKVYEFPEVKPLTVIGDIEPVPVKPPLLDVTVYPVIAEPPLSAGAEKVILAEVPLVTVAVPIVGAPGTVLGSGHIPPAIACIC